MSSSTPADLPSVGQKVKARGKAGIVRFVGKTEFATGDWIGVELEKPTGKNDGSVHGKRYFECAPNFGLFLKPSQVVILTGSKEDTATSRLKTPSRIPIRTSQKKSDRKKSDTSARKPSLSPVRSSRLRPPSSRGQAKAALASATTRKVERTPRSLSSSRKTVSPSEKSGRSAPSRSPCRDAKSVRTPAKGRNTPGAAGSRETVRVASPAMKKQLDELKSQLESTKIALETTKTALETTKTELKATASELEVLKTEREAEREKASEVASKMKESADEERDAAERANAELESTRSELEKLKQRFAEMASKQDTLVKSAAQGQASVAKAERSVADMKRKLEEKDEIMELCTLEKEEIEVELDSLKDQLSDATLEVEQLKRELEQAREEIGSSKVDGSSSSSEDASVQNEKLRRALAALHAQSTKFKQESAKKMRALEKSAESVPTLQASAKRLGERCAELEAENGELKDAVDDGAAYESMIEELTRSDMEKSDRIAELEKTVDEMSEMETLAQEETEELQSTLKSVREELESKSSKLYKMVPLVQRLQQEMRERTDACDRFRASLQNVRGERDDLRNKLSRAQRRREDDSDLVQSARTERLTMRALENARRRLTLQLARANTDVELARARSRNLSSLVSLNVVRDGMEIIESIDIMSRLSAKVRLALGAPTFVDIDASAPEDALLSAMSGCSMRSRLLSLRHHLDGMFAFIRSPDTTDEEFVEMTSVVVCARLRDADVVVTDLLNRITENTTCPEIAARELERVTADVAKIATGRAARLECNVRFACDAACLGLAQLSLSARVALARSSEMSRELSEDPDHDDGASTKSAVAASEVADRLRKLVVLLRAATSNATRVARDVYESNDVASLEIDESVCEELVRASHELVSQSETLVSDSDVRSEDDGNGERVDWSAFLDKIGLETTSVAAEEHEDAGRKSKETQESASVFRIVSTVHELCASLLRHRSSSPAVVEGSNDDDTFAEPLTHIASRKDSDAPLSIADASEDSPWSRYVDIVRARFDSIARLEPDLKETRETLKQRERSLAEARRQETKSRIERETLETRLKEELLVREASQKERDELRSQNERATAKSSQLEVVVSDLSQRVDDLSDENKALRDRVGTGIESTAGRRKGVVKTVSSPEASASGVGTAAAKSVSGVSDDEFEALQAALRCSRRSVAYWRYRESQADLMRSLPKLPRVISAREKLESVASSGKGEDSAVSSTLRRLRKVQNDLARFQTSTTVIRLEQSASSAIGQLHEKFVAATRLKRRTFELEAQIGGLVARASRRCGDISTGTFESKEALGETKREGSGHLIGRVRFSKSLPGRSSSSSVIPIHVGDKSFLHGLHSQLLF